jgi:hypothetical protein
VIDVSELTVKTAVTPPNMTTDASVKPLPVIVTCVPPAVPPLDVLSPRTVGPVGQVK